MEKLLSRYSLIWKQVQGIVLSQIRMWTCISKQVVKEGDNEKVVFGGLFQRVRVTAAKDSNTEDAFVLEKKESKEEQEGKQKPKVTRLYTLAVSLNNFNT